MLEQGRHPLVQDAALLAHLLGVLRQALLPPAVVDRLQQGDQRGGGRDQHPPAHPLLQQRGRVLDGGAEDGLARQEHHHELRRLRQLGPVGLAAQLGQVGAHLGPVLLRRARR